MAPRLRPRYGRISALLMSAGVSVVALLGGLGAVGAPAPGSSSYADAGQHSLILESMRRFPGARNARRATQVQPDADLDLPAGSGAGRRVVFDMSAQRVWLVAADGTVQRSYLVSGSLTDNLDAGQYAVYSRSRHAVGVEDSGTMQYFVRFARGDNAAIGFHDIPALHGHPLQTRAELGTPQSHGCIRQALSDAIRLWKFAPVGTHVDVVA